MLDGIKSIFRWRHKYIPLPLVYGAQFRKTMAFLKRSRDFSEEQLQDYVWSRLQALIRHAYEKTKFYRKLYDSAGAQPGDIKSFADYGKLPVVTREMVRDNLEDMKPTNFQLLQPILTRTTGTTAYPLSFYRNKKVETVRLATVWRHYHEIGYRYQQPRLTIARPFDDRSITDVHDLSENNLQLNTYLLNPIDFHKIHQPALRFKPRLIFAHPAAIYTFCLLTESLGFESIKAPLLVTFAEKLYPYHIKKLRQHLGCTIFDYYGNRENSVSVSQLPCRSYHTNSELSYLEFVNDGKPAATGEEAAIISTSLENYATPFLRYDTEDFGKYLGKCLDCNLAHPVIEIGGGRRRDALLTRKGYLNCHVDSTLIDRQFTGIDFMQIVQESIDEVTVKIVAGIHYERERDEEELVRIVDLSLKGFFRIKLQYLETVPFTSGGKAPFVISNMGE